MEKHWYALKIFYNKVFEMEEHLRSRGVECFIPTVRVELKGEDFFKAKRRLSTVDETRRGDNRYIVEDPKIFRRKTIVSSLIFVRMTGAEIKGLVSDFWEGKLPVSGFVYTRVNPKNGKREAQVIPDRQMDIFMMVVNSGVAGLDFFSEEKIVNYTEGDRVRVLRGPLKGAEGYIKRIRKDRRLLVSVRGFIAVATCFIPFDDLEKIETEEEEPNISQQ
mgnify:CR=1 FL=1